MKKCYFAGGCFWCIAGPFYELVGEDNVISGYSGGNEVNPKYEDVKNQLTHHKETICIIYDEKEVSLEKLVDIYLLNVDPFDKDGQFIDRGKSYTLALFYNDDFEFNLYKRKIQELEARHNKKCYIDLIKFDKFYKAEEYQNELRKSGRLK